MTTLRGYSPDGRPNGTYPQKRGGPARVRPAVWKMLKQSKRELTGSEIAERLKLSRAVVYKALGELWRVGSVLKRRVNDETDYTITWTLYRVNPKWSADES